MSAKVFQQSASGLPFVITIVEDCVDVSRGSRSSPVSAIGTICTVYHMNTLTAQTCHGLTIMDISRITHRRTISAVDRVCLEQLVDVGFHDDDDPVGESYLMFNVILILMKSRFILRIGGYLDEINKKRKSQPCLPAED